MIIPSSNGNLKVSDAEKRLAYSAWFQEQCLKFLFMHRAMLLKIVADGKTNFNNSYKRLMTGLMYSETMGDGFWEACKHMLYGDQLGGKAVPHNVMGKPWPNDQAKLWAFAELDALDRTKREKYSERDWHAVLGSEVQR